MRGGGRESAKIYSGYVFSGHLIREGDILLSTDPDNKVSQIIKRVTGGNFSHVAICTTPPLFIEADDPNVAEFSLARKGLKSKGNAEILRLKDTVENGVEIARKAALAALRYQSHDYSYILAVSSVIPFLGGKSPARAAFCSYLVAAAYASAGLNLTKDSKEPIKTTPADIQVSPFLDIITSTLLERASFRPEWGPHFFIDEASPPSPAQEEGAAFSEIVKRMDAFLKSKGLSGIQDVHQHHTHTAERAYMSSLKEPWFEELDIQYAAWLEELILFSLDRAESLADSARVQNAATLADRLESSDQPSLVRSFQFVDNQIRDTERLMHDSVRVLNGLRAVVLKLELKAARVLLARQCRIYLGFQKNLTSFRKERDEHLVHAARRGWQLS